MSCLDDPNDPNDPNALNALTIGRIDEWLLDTGYSIDGFLTPPDEFCAEFV